PESIGERDRAGVRAVLEVADELGATASQVATGWAVRRGVHPILGVSSAEQLKDNLGASDVARALTDEAIARLESAVPFELGFPGDFVGEVDRSPDIYGDALPRLHGR
ncbi:aldo/keto reductase, partial [Nonomuraea sp. MG754425]|uniref:aldo/keto reductase n=1 Tax=Nonomuraea sp. MG754425 TaxID=2570319 RepID=UPI001F188522